MSDWRPIETAPRDGSVILIKNDYDRLEPQVPMWWNGRRKRWETYVFSVVGRRVAWWSEEHPQPSAWKPAA